MKTKLVPQSMDAAKVDVYRGNDTDPSRGDMAMMTPRHLRKSGKRGKSEQAAARAEQARRRDKHESRALSYF